MMLLLCSFLLYAVHLLLSVSLSQSLLVSLGSGMYVRPRVSLGSLIPDCIASHRIVFPHSSSSLRPSSPLVIASIRRSSRGSRLPMRPRLWRRRRLFRGAAFIASTEASLPHLPRGSTSRCSTSDVMHSLRSLTSVVRIHRHLPSSSLYIDISVRGCT
ncbi:hypothetical protein C8Q76DRAFT_365272 [Earliella scabrosa]|nr:hypothetical protein C8Q76DRAFT_365272 [Earliella scabrosa]